MLGDIVSNSSRPASRATAVRPAGSPPPADYSGYGVSSFGERPAVRPLQAQPPVQTSRPQPRPFAQASASAPSVARGVASSPVSEAVAIKAAPVMALLPEKTKRVSKVPLVLTIIGIVIFIGGVTGLFMYALGGK